MADALVSLVLEQLVFVVEREVEQQVRLVVGVRKEVKRLTTTLISIQQVLKDAEEKQVNDDRVKIWLEQLKDISYDADDVLDEWHTKILLSQTQKSDFSFSPFSFCTPVPVMLRHDIAHRIKEIRERLDEVSRDKDQYNFNESSIHSMEKKFTRLPTSSFVDTSEIYGRDADKKTLVSKLMNEDSVVSVISIVGTGGFGKTTLAQLILKEAEVAKFGKPIWVSVSQSFNHEKVAREIIEQAEGNVPNTVGWQALHKSLCDALRGKLFLLVLDDVWSYDDRQWRQLKFSLDGGAPGSRIIITTRDESLAKTMNSSYIHRLQQLSDDDCWSLFKHIAFQDRQSDLEKLEEIGKEITLKCKGVPLAARILASLMSSKVSKQDWIDILASDIWEITSDDVNGVLPELWLSYYALPSPLKQCLMYCAVFQKGEELNKVELVKLWMAQGFLGSDGTENLEKVGAGYFLDLAMRSFFHGFVKDEEGNIAGCKMHDLVHDFAQLLTSASENEFGSIHSRHLSAFNLSNPSIYKLKNLRTLRPFAEEWFDTVPPLVLFDKLACLRALDLHGIGLHELPKEVERLLHLRYLNLSHTKLKSLPETICNLLNLQTLKLNGCYSLLKLPEGIGELSNLRHLEIQHTDELNSLPTSIGKLCRLRSLCKFIVGEGCHIGELKHLKYLQGSLSISGLERVADINEAQQAELWKKQNIHTLQLVFADDVGFSQRDEEIVLNGLQPHRDLEKLKICFYSAPKYPSWISLLSNLVELRLYECSGCSRLPCLGKLASLEVLELDSISSVRHIGSEFYGINTNSSHIAFPKLKELFMAGMTELDEWELPASNDIMVMPCLTRLSIKDCQKLQQLTGFGKLKSLQHFVLAKSGIKYLGLEFLGISSVSAAGDSIVFPELKTLKFYEMDRLQEWQFPIHSGAEIMPNLVELELCACTSLQALPALGRLNSLETLRIELADKVKHVDLEFLGILGLDDDSTDRIVSFPRLKFLRFNKMYAWEKWNLPLEHKGVFFPHLCELELGNCTRLQALPALEKLSSLRSLHLSYMGEWEGKEVSLPTNTIMPCLHRLSIIFCPKLKVLPRCIFSHQLRYLKIAYCPQLRGVQPCLPPQLEELHLGYDVGVLSRSLSIFRFPGNNYPNLKLLEIESSPYSSLPEGFHRLRAVQKLIITQCGFHDFVPEDLRSLTMLQELRINNCPFLSDCCRKRRNWGDRSHIPNIIINTKYVPLTY